MAATSYGRLNSYLAPQVVSLLRLRQQVCTQTHIFAPRAERHQTESPGGGYLPPLFTGSLNWPLTKLHEGWTDGIA